MPNDANRVVLTPEGKRKLEEELAELKGVKRKEIADEIRTAGLQDGLNLHGRFCHPLIQQTTVAHAPFRQQEILRKQLLSSEQLLFCQRMVGTGDKMDTDLFLCGDHIVIVVDVVELGIKLSEAHHLPGKFSCIFCDVTAQNPALSVASYNRQC